MLRLENKTGGKSKNNEDWDQSLFVQTSKFCVGPRRVQYLANFKTAGSPPEFLKSTLKKSGGISIYCFLRVMSIKSDQVWRYLKKSNLVPPEKPLNTLLLKTSPGTPYVTPPPPFPLLSLWRMWFVLWFTLVSHDFWSAFEEKY